VSRLDHDLVTGFHDGALGPSEEALLAEQVARLLPYHWALPNPVAADLAELTSSFNGVEGLLEWLAGHPGRPRLVAELYTLIALLDSYSANPAVIKALREARTRSTLPPIVGLYLAPDTDSATLAGLAWAIENLLGEDRVDDAVQLALGTAMLAAEVGKLASADDPSADDLVVEAGRARAAITEAHKLLTGGPG
jgi:hypothetical protein